MRERLVCEGRLSPVVVLVALGQVVLVQVVLVQVLYRMPSGW